MPIVNSNFTKIYIWVEFSNNSIQFYIFKLNGASAPERMTANEFREYEIDILEVRAYITERSFSLGFNELKEFLQSTD